MAHRVLPYWITQAFVVVTSPSLIPWSGQSLSYFFLHLPKMLSFEFSAVKIMQGKLGQTILLPYARQADSESILPLALDNSPYKVQKSMQFSNTITM